MVYPHKWLPISYRSSAGQRKHAGQRPMLYRWTTQPTTIFLVHVDIFLRHCALLGGFAIGARVALLWQHNANPTYKLASTPRYDGIVRTRNVSECSVLALCLVVVCRGRLWFISPARRSRMDEHTPNQQSKDSWLYGKRRRRN